MWRNNTMEFKKFIAKAHQEAHMCNATVEVHDWIDWFGKELSNKTYDETDKNYIVTVKWFDG